MWAPGSRIFPQEPTFVPRPHATAEDDGWVVCTVFDGETQKTDVVILDAQRLAAGPVATIHLPHHIPPGANPSERERRERERGWTWWAHSGAGGNAVAWKSCQSAQLLG